MSASSGESTSGRGKTPPAMTATLTTSPTVCPSTSEDLHQHLSHACTLLQAQQTLIDELVSEVGRLRAERDEARQVHALLEAVLDRLALFAPLNQT
jgi:hypothetical protein